MPALAGEILPRARVDLATLEDVRRAGTRAYRAYCEGGSTSDYLRVQLALKVQAEVIEKIAKQRERELEMERAQAFRAEVRQRLNIVEERQRNGLFNGSGLAAPAGAA